MAVRSWSDVILERSVPDEARVAESMRMVDLVPPRVISREASLVVPEKSNVVSPVASVVPREAKVEVPVTFAACSVAPPLMPLLPPVLSASA